jgi:hypothetical protein
MLFEKRNVRFVAALLALIALGGCTRKQEGSDDPKRRLNEYISESFAVRGPQDRARLSAYLAGDAKTRLESWSDEQFRLAFVDSKRKFVKLAFKEAKPVSENEVGITYELTYQASYGKEADKPREAKVTNRKLAQMIRRDGQWFISDVRNIKELVEYQNEMSLP